MAYAKYALSNPHLYRAIHEGTLWRAVTAPPTDEAAAKQRDWTTAAREARDEAFAVFVRAIEKARLKTDDPGMAARVITCLVDGFCFRLLKNRWMLTARSRRNWRTLNAWSKWQSEGSLCD